jgi:hypothetical protein
MKIKSKTYDKIKFISTTVLPAATTLVLGLGIYGLSHAKVVGGVIALVDTFTGSILHGLSKSYQKSKKNVPVA